MKKSAVIKRRVRACLGKLRPSMLASMPRCAGHRVCVGFLLLTLATFCASAANPKRVLIVHSFGSASPPFTTHSIAFETELTEKLGAKVDLDEISLDEARYESADMKEALVDYIRKRQDKWRPDLVVPIGSPACVFVAENRERLFPETPILYTGTASRRLPAGALQKNAAFIGEEFNLPGFVEDILQVAPATTNIAVVIGASPVEQYWTAAFRKEFAPFTNRVSFMWLNDLPFDQVLERVKKLPPRSFIFLILLHQDAAGVTLNADDALKQIHAVANAPVNSVFVEQMGLGIVGGRLYQAAQEGVESAHLAIRILHGESASSIPPKIVGPLPPQYDWRELQRWKISEANLPTESVIKFRQPTLWQQYRWHMVGVLLFCGLQAFLIVALVTNNLARKRADRELRQSEERLRLAAEAAEFGVYVWNITRNQIWGSETWRKLFGFASGDDIGFEGFFQRIHPDDREMMEQEIKCRASGQPDHLREYRIILPDGTQRWMASRGRMQAAETGGDFVMLGVAIEITRRKQAEAELLRQRAELAHVARVSTMGELAASMAHELNQPLGAILANAEAAELFLEQKPPALDDLRATLADIRKDDERASQVIRRMRALLRKHELEVQPVEINSMVEEVLQLVSGDAALRRISLAADLLPFLPKISGDRVHLQQVLLNLILNGMDAMADQPPGRRQISVRTRLSGDGLVELAVIDSGQGIEPSKLPHLFEPFYTTKSNGMGMGLSIARTIVNVHRGRIWAENNASGGATFRVTLPVLDARQLGDEAH
jgi:PAS domain S-box-containing protein